MAAKDLYPLDIERAFKSLNKLKPNIAQYPNAAKSIEVLQRGEIEYAYTYSGRIEIAKNNGASVDFVYGPQKKAAFDGLSDAVKRKMPSMDSPQAAWINVEWWAKNRDKIDIRFKEWQIS